MEVTGVPCYVDDDPLSCVAVGTGLALERMDNLRDRLEWLWNACLLFDPMSMRLTPRH